MEQEAPDTVTDAVRLLSDEGYTTDLGVQDGGLRCGDCGYVHDASEVGIERVFRFEGESDPGDEAIVFGLACPRCGSRGTLVTAYGSAADPDEVAVVSKLVDRRYV